VSFEDAFMRSDAQVTSIDQSLARLVNLLLQGSTPRPSNVDLFPRVLASNSNFGLSMNWAMSDAERKQKICQTLYQQLQLFDVYLDQSTIVEVEEDDVRNQITFNIKSRYKPKFGKADIDWSTGLSLLDQNIGEVRL
jgi:hypothetical protein|tara:strand:+ start:695 stop:1105 length:411 start_codon:yes stop_codon:yes gene_type:complete